MCGGRIEKSLYLLLNLASSQIALEVFLKFFKSSIKINIFPRSQNTAVKKGGGGDELPQDS